MTRIGAVVIGRNEGDRLRVCLESLRRTYPSVSPVVYSDSASTDASVKLAALLGADVLQLDASKQLCAARGRNEGLERLLEIDPSVEFVQFIDGDCEICAGWLESAAGELAADPGQAIVCGRVRERNRNQTVYNRLCDMEFNRPAGLTEACGGIFLARPGPLREIGGFNPTVVAGEEAEMCRRLRDKGYKIRRLDQDMCLHDSALTHFRQWWRRSVRSGYAYATLARAGGSHGERAGVKELWSAGLWALLLPLVVLALAWPTHGLSVLLLAVYGFQIVRVAARRKRPGESIPERLLYGVSCVVIKWPQLVGHLRYVLETRGHGGDGHARLPLAGTSVHQR